jgi:hypothetical protein
MKMRWEWHIARMEIRGMHIENGRKARMKETARKTEM